MFDMINMMGKLKELQKKMDEVQENLSYLRATGEAGAGLVKATVTGKRQVVSVEIDPSILQAKDQSMVQDLIVAAVNKALDEAAVLAKEEFQKSTGGLLPNIPGLDLSNFTR